MEYTLRLSNSPRCEKMPVFLLGTFHEDSSEAVLRYAEELCPGRAFAIAAFRCEDGRHDFSPWEAPNAMGGELSGGGTALLRDLETDVVPRLQAEFPGSPLFLAGYSLGGLFALWALYESDVFSGGACCSGSLWIDGWDAYTDSRCIRQPGVVYLSLGGKEERSASPVIASIGARTRAQEKRLRKDPNVSASTLEMNPGGHFSDPAKRLAKGIRWILEHI